MDTSPEINRDIDRHEQQIQKLDDRTRKLEVYANVAILVAVILGLSGGAIYTKLTSAIGKLEDLERKTRELAQTVDSKLEAAIKKIDSYSEEKLNEISRRSISPPISGQSLNQVNAFGGLEPGKVFFPFKGIDIGFKLPNLDWKQTLYNEVDMKYEFNNPSNGLGGVLIMDKLKNMPIQGIIDFQLNTIARNSGGSASILRQSKVKHKSKELTEVLMSLNFSGTKASFFGWVYSGNEGTVQVYCNALEQLDHNLEAAKLEFLSGLEFR